jgi:hypothetical protein
MLCAPIWRGGSKICGHGINWRFFSPSALVIDRFSLVAQRFPTTLLISGLDHAQTPCLKRASRKPPELGCWRRMFPPLASAA